jgi:hypothetical protein
MSPCVGAQSAFFSNRGCSRSHRPRLGANHITHQRTGVLRRRKVSIAAQAKGDDTPVQQSFYQKLGAPKHILAPMVAQSDLPFRLMCEHLYNIDLSYTQMIHAYNFVESNGEVFRKHHLDVYQPSFIRNVLLGNADREEIVLSRSQQNALIGLSESDVDSARMRILHAMNGPKQIDVKPTVVQIAAHDPKVALEAALMILERSNSAADGDASPVAAIDLNLGEYIHSNKHISQGRTLNSHESHDMDFQVVHRP